MEFAKISFKTSDGRYTESLFCRKSEIDSMERNLNCDVLFRLPFVLRGHSYQERKESLRDLAIDFQYNNDGETDVQLCMGELAAAERFFEREGRKYGLLREFRENAII